MKDTILILTMAAALLTAGCQMFNGSDEQSANRLRTDAELISYVGSALYLQSNPTDRPKFEAARSALDLLVMDEQLDSGSVIAALQQLPVDSLKGGNGSILFNSGLLLLERFGGGGPNQILPDQVRIVAIGIRDGLSRALPPAQ